MSQKGRNKTEMKGRGKGLEEGRVEREMKKGADNKDVREGKTGKEG